MPSGGGYYPQVGRNLVNQRSNSAKNAPVLPGRIKCYVCKKSKDRDEYANRQLQRLKDSIYNPYAPSGRTTKDPKVTCKLCTPQQTAELKCTVCDEVKALDKFAKQQRKNPDRARCIKCVEFHRDAEPDVELPDHDDYRSDSDSADFDSPMDSRGITYEPPAPTRAVKDIEFHDDEDDDDEEGKWTKVEAAGTDTTAVAGPDPRYEAEPAPATYRSGMDDSRKPGWPKTKKSSKAGEINRSDFEEDSSEWASYGRGLRERREGLSTQAKKGKKKNRQIDDEDEW